MPSMCSHRSWRLFLVGVAGMAAGVGCAAEPAGWQADPALQEELAKKKVAWVFREQDVAPYTLPDPLVCADGSRIASAAEWESKGRPQTLELFSRYVYGRTPPVPSEVRFEILENKGDAMEGKATLKRVRITSIDSGKSFAFEAAVLVPNDRPGKVPAFLLINNRPVTSADPTRQTRDPFWSAEEIIGRGYAAAVFRTNDVDADKNDQALRAQGVRGVWPGAADDGWATIGAWAWGASRVMDYLVSDPSIDGTKVAVVGHSRGGKTALWAGAQDTRFSLVVSNDSGCGGAALSRRRFGETIAAINKGFPYWFCGDFKQFNDREEQLPIDQHQLIALIAPRAVYVASADGDFWADQRGEFLAAVHAGPVYRLYGLSGLTGQSMPPLERPIFGDRLAYHIRRGGHGLTLYDWERFMDFAAKVWGR